MRLKASDKMTDTEKNLVNFGLLIGGPLPGPVYTCIPPEMTEDDVFEQTKGSLASCLGDGCRITKTDYPGAIELGVDKLTDDGARRLGRGYWTPPKDSNGDSMGHTVIAFNSSTPFGTAAAPVKLGP